MGTSLGRPDSGATNDLDANGNVVATGTGVKTVADPNQGMTDGQMKNRNFASGAIKTLGQAMSSTGGPTGSSTNGANPPNTFTFANNQPAYQPPQPQSPQKMKNPFFGY